jgi:hypothetical protein
MMAVKKSKIEAREEIEPEDKRLGTTPERRGSDKQNPIEIQ